MDPHDSVLVNCDQLFRSKSCAEVQHLFNFYVFEFAQLTLNQFILHKTPLVVDALNLLFFF